VICGGFVRDIKRRDTHEYQFASCGDKIVTMMHLDARKGELAIHPIGFAGKHVRKYTCLAFVHDNEYLLAGTTTGDVGVAVMKSRVMQTFWPVCSGGVTNLVPVPSGDGQLRIVVGGGDGTATLMTGSSVLDMKEERQIRLDSSLVSMNLSSDRSQVLAVSSAGTGYLIMCKDLSVMLHSQVSSRELFDVAYLSGISDLFLTCCKDGIVTLWDANDYSAKLRCPVRPAACPVSVAGTEDVIIAGCNDGRLMCYDSTEGQNLWHIDNAHKGSVTSVKISSNVRFVISGGAEGELRIWEFKTKEMVSNLKEHTARVNEVKLFPNDQYAVSVGRDRCLLTWDLRTEKRLTAHREKHGGINCLAVASNQTSVITAGQEKTLTYWDLRMADPVKVIDLDEEVHSISLSPDDRYLATAGQGLAVKLWDVNAGAEQCRCFGHSRAVQKLSFSPDGKQIVSVGLDHSILVWNCYM